MKGWSSVVTLIVAVLRQIARTSASEQYREHGTLVGLCPD